MKTIIQRGLKVSRPFLLLTALLLLVGCEVDSTLNDLGEADPGEPGQGIEDSTAHKQLAADQDQAPLAPAAAQIKGWVWANQPAAAINAAYTPSLPYQYNSSGANNRVVRLGNGVYRVIFPGLATAGGTVQVSAYGGNHTCQVTSWVPAGGDQQVNVRCFRPNGNPVNGRFTVLFYRHGPLASPAAAYLWASNANASHTPSLAYQWNSTGATNEVDYLGVGRYRARLTGLDVSGGTVLVTAYGTSARRCKVVNWYPSGGDLLVNVNCFNANGAPANSRFALSFRTNVDVNAGFALGSGHHGGYVWANQAAGGGCYTPSLAYQRNSEGSNNTACKFPPGSYRVNFPDLVPSDKTTALVTAYGGDNRYCTVTSWASDGSGGTNANIRCFDANGDAANARFTLSYLTDVPTAVVLFP